MSWHPSASLAVLRQRSQALAAIREFFAGRAVWEVDTPLLASSTATDPHLTSFRVDTPDADRYLQTSPEFAMKRLLAAGSGAIYQLGKAFRQEEQGRLHNPEFTLLEWYRPGWTLTQLISETLDLINHVSDVLGCPRPPVSHCLYHDLFLRHCQLDPHAASLAELQTCVARLIPAPPAAPERDECLHLLMSHCIEPEMPTGLLVVSEFPASQAALAQLGVNAQGHAVALRSEIYWHGVELANGYQELLDANEQRRRFTHDLAERQRLALAPLPMPAPLLDALNEGLPDCAGIALGFDRLLMCLLGHHQLDAVLPFSFQRA